MREKAHYPTVVQLQVDAYVKAHEKDEKKTSEKKEALQEVRLGIR